MQPNGWKTNGAINWTGDNAKQIDCDFSCKGGFKYHNTGKNRGCTACEVNQWTPDDNQSPDCKPCNPIPPNAHYTGPSNSAKCKWECDPGYNQVGNSCRKAIWTKRDRDVCRNTGNRRDSYKSIFRVCSDGYSDNVSAQICNHWGSKPNDYTRETSDDSCNPPTWVNVGCDSCRPNDCGTIEVKCTEELQDPAGTSYGTRYTKENRYCGQCYTPPPQNNNCKCDNPKENDREGNVLTSCQLGNPGDYKVSYDSIEYICKKRVQGVGYCDPVTCERNCKEGYKLKVEWVDREVFGQTITYANAECVPSGSSNPNPPSYSCQGSIPENAERASSSEETGLTSNLSWIGVSGNTSRKCEWTCKQNYTLHNNRCANFTAQCMAKGQPCETDSDCCQSPTKLHCAVLGADEYGSAAQQKICRDNKRTVRAKVSSPQISFARPALGHSTFSIHNPTTLEVTVGTWVQFNSAPTTPAGDPLSVGYTMDGRDCSDGISYSQQNIRKQITKDIGNLVCTAHYSLNNGGWSGGDSGGSTNKSCQVNPSVQNSFEGVPGVLDTAFMCSRMTNEAKCRSYRCAFESFGGRKGAVGCSDNDREELERQLARYNDQVLRILPICDYF